MTYGRVPAEKKEYYSESMLLVEELRDAWSSPPCLEKGSDRRKVVQGFRGVVEKAERSLSLASLHRVGAVGEEFQAKASFTLHCQSFVPLEEKKPKTMRIKRSNKAAKAR